MDFVSLEQALEGIAGRVKKPEEVADLPDLVETWKYSQAAATLHALLLNYPDRAPRWMTPHEVTGRPIFNDAIGSEGLEILVHLSGWFKRHLRFRAGHRLLASRPYEESELEEIAKAAHHYKYRWGTLSRSYHMGFNRADLVRFLIDAHIEFSHRLGGDHAGARGAPTPTQLTGPHPRVPVAPDESDGKAPAESVAPAAGAVPRLTLPAKSDTWAKVIEATYDLLVRETGAAPSGVQVWLRLNHEPPTTYPVSVTKDRGLPAIVLPGDKPLTRDGFNKRWQRYTTAN